MFIDVEQIFDIQKKVSSATLVEKDNEFHKEIAKCLMENYDLALKCFSSCSVDFFLWFEDEFVYEIIQIIRRHKKMELLLALKNNLDNQTGYSLRDRITSIDVIYHSTYKILI